MSTYSVILAAAGRSSRFDDPYHKKPFAILNRKAVWLHSADLFLKRNDVKQVIIVIAPEDKEDFLANFGPNIAVLGVEVVLGGAERADSVQNALNKVDPRCDYVAIHDAARPCINADLIESIFQASKKHKVVIPAVPVSSTLKRSIDGTKVDETVDRSNLYLAQTPQVFEREVLSTLYKNRGDAQPTDEAQLAEMQNVPVALVAGSALNIKITTREDMRFAKACIAAMPTPKFDAPIHPFADDNLFR